MADPYEMGRDARIEGKTRNANPFIRCKDGAHAWWNDGFDAAHRVLENAEREAHALKHNRSIEEERK
jgi:hypothetical protein